MMPSITVEPLVNRGELIEVVPGVRVRTSLYWQTRSQSSEILESLSRIVSSVAAEWLYSFDETATEKAAS